MQPMIHYSGDLVSLYADGALQSRIDRRKPRHLISPYLTWMAHVAECHLAAQNGTLIAHLGGGLLALPRYLAVDPNIQQVVYELDPILVRANPQITATPANVTILQGDGRIGIRDMAPGSLDLIVVDALDTMSGSVYLSSAEFFAECANSLSDRGTLTMNAASISDVHMRRVRSGLERSFPHVGVIGPRSVRADVSLHNVVFFGTHASEVSQAITMGADKTILNDARHISIEGWAPPYSEKNGDTAPIAFSLAACISRVRELEEILKLCPVDDPYFEELQIVHSQLSELTSQPITR